jgi:redox-sensitive bicupin YhaK (pirin superfamily)
MPAITVHDTSALPRVPGVDPGSRPRPVTQIVTSVEAEEGAGIHVHRPFPGGLSMAGADPFLLLDHAGPKHNGPGEAKGGPWHPHRGFETVTYLLDGEMVHQDTSGGGGVLRDGDIQWMTAGRGVLHDELPTERMYREGGPFHAVQLWVNLPRGAKMSDPRYQTIAADSLALLVSDDGGALVRLIAGDIGSSHGPGETHTPITYAHATLAPGARLELPWPAEFSAFAYALTGYGSVGADRRSLDPDRLAVFGPGDHIAARAADDQTEPLELLLLGGLPIREPIAHYGPFVMNTRDEILQAIEDFQAGRFGTVPEDQIADRSFA